MNADNSRPTRGGHRHRRTALAWCVPMLLILSALILTGVIGLGSALLGVASVAVMATVTFTLERMENH